MQNRPKPAYAQVESLAEYSDIVHNVRSHVIAPDKAFFFFSVKNYRYFPISPCKHTLEVHGGAFIQIALLIWNSACEEQPGY